MFDASRVGGYGTPPAVGIPHASRDATEEKDRDQPSHESTEEHDEATSPEGAASRRTNEQGVGDNIDLEA